MDKHAMHIVLAHKDFERLRKAAFDRHEPMSVILRRCVARELDLIEAEASW